MIINNNHLTEINSPVRKIQAKVELYEGSTLVNTFSYTDKLISFNVERVGEGKFFGFGFCQKANIKLIDKDIELDITTANHFKIYFGVNDEYISPFPNLYVTEVHRNENNGELSITAYDAIKDTTQHTYNELNITSNTIDNAVEAITAALGLNGYIYYGEGNLFWIDYPELNYEGTEDIREVLNGIAEATASIYYIDSANNLVFKVLSNGGSATITKEDYFTLNSKTNRRLTDIVSVTDLGENISISTGSIGSTQYVRNNPYWSLNTEHITEYLEQMQMLLYNFTINQFECEWRGNYLVEIGDELKLVTKDDTTVISFLLNDTISYDGSLKQKSSWSYEENEEETASNPVTLGETLKDTYAKVDKANKQIDIVASEIKANEEAISSLQINTEGINASIQAIEKNTSDAFNNLNGEIDTLTNRVDATMTPEEVRIEIKTELENGVSKVKTNTGFIFNDEGLTISKSDNDISTTITEDGMTIYRRDNKEDSLLVANNQGVIATNLYAKTFLIIGGRSRFEDFDKDGEERTGCFWIGN